MESNKTVRMLVKVPKWVGAPEAMKNVGFMMGLTVDLDVDKGWFRETIRATITGKPEAVDIFKRAFRKALDSQNLDLD